MNDESVKVSKEEEEEEEYVLMDLDDVSRHIDIPPDAPYTLSVTFKLSYLLMNFFCLRGYIYYYIISCFVLVSIMLYRVWIL